jgi:hypothetical protein
MALHKICFISLLLPIVILGSQGSSHRQRPTLGFIREKGASLVTDSDAEALEQNLSQKPSPDDIVRNSREVHDAALFADFLDSLKHLKDCSGIKVSVKPNSLPPDFLVLLSVSGLESHPDNQSWFWIVSHPGVKLREGMPSIGLGGMGSATNAKLTAGDVCRTIWEDLDPNRMKKPAKAP